MGSLQRNAVRRSVPSTGSSSSLGDSARRLFTETKAAFKTTEFGLTVAVIVTILVGAMAIGAAKAPGLPGAQAAPHDATPVHLTPRWAGKAEQIDGPPLNRRAADRSEWPATANVRARMVG